MKTKPTSIETLLESGKELSLTEQERSLMLSELKSYATFHKPQEAPPEKERIKSGIPLYAKWVVAISSAFLLVFGTGFASTESLPGEPLYVIKVSVVEPVLGLANTAESEQLYYQVSLIEKRLDEIQELSRTDKLSENEVRIVENQIEAHAQDIEEIFIEQDISESISDVESLEAMSDVLSALKSEEIIVAKHTGRGVKKSQAIEKMQTRYVAELEDMAEGQSDETVLYIEEVLAEISDKTASTSPAVNEIGDYLLDVSAALEKGEMREALFYTGEAQQTAEVSENLEEILDEEVGGE